MDNKYFAHYNVLGHFLEGRKKSTPAGMIAHLNAGDIVSEFSPFLGSGVISLTKVAMSDTKLTKIPRPSVIQPPSKLKVS